MDRSRIIQSLRAVADKIERNQPLTATDLMNFSAAAKQADSFRLEKLLESDKVMTRTDFDKLPADEANAFIMDGGRLVDVPREADKKQASK